MHISKYTKLIKKFGRYYIYNSLSNFFAEIDASFFEYLEEKNKSKESVDKEDFDENIWDRFCRSKILTENEEDDILMYNAIIKNQRQINNSLLLTIAPTMDCNFFCPYCFETKEKGIMNESTVQNLINWIAQYKNIEFIRITWFGGEPLLVPNVIKNITDGIKEASPSIEINANIITNGYYLTTENIELLNDCGIKSIQLSIDGIYESHNKKRFTKTDHSTFDVILKNIDSFNRLNSDIKMMIRVGLDKDNKHEYQKIHDFFRNRYPENKNIMILPALIIETTKHSCNESCLTDTREKYEFHKEFSLHTGNPYFAYPSNIISECAVRNQNSWAIDAKGNLYKCWEIIGNSSYKVGELNENGIRITDAKMLNRYLFGADPLEDTECRQCFSLPICGGGCPHKRIENKFNGGSFNNCTYFKDNMEDYLLLRTLLPVHNPDLQDCK